MLPSFLKFDNTQKNIIEITFDHKHEGVYFLLKKLYPILLKSVFDNREIEIITINPSSDSLCYDSGNLKEYYFGKDKLTVNRVAHPSIDLFKQIASSFEFELGTMAVAVSDSYTSEDRTKNIYDIVSNGIDSPIRILIHTFCFCETDGYIIYLINAIITESKLDEIISNALMLL